ncbi:copper resistance protein NlpE N-terminal domain-containing protein [Formosa sp. S-31]|uniref:copper resistance protein NlpE N-terminal domain-containing protein n=1 Tax=Formosa sp. S-31 TaxID=2790949 RepID=UPI003EC100C5
MLKHTFTLLILSVVLLNCKSADIKTADTAHNSMNSLDWNGIYTGTLPCADCEGLKTVIELHSDLRYTEKTQYLGKQETVNETTGTFSWNASGNMITLYKGSAQQSYLVGEGRLTHLDANQNKITGEQADQFILTQQSEHVLTDKPWKLIELRGKTIEDRTPQPYFKLHKAEARISGNSSCNGFGGDYELLEGNRIQFSKLMHTMRACIDMSIENEFLKVLETADNYTISNGILSLNKGRMAPLAKFKVDYFINN